jgi:RNA polymerase sigma-70 factor (ECF subfamily)
MNRKRGSRLETVALEEGRGILADETPEQALMRGERMDELLELIETLPDLQQAILRMKHIEGMEVEEIARLTGSNPIAVRTNLSRARKKVREQFLMRNKEWK